MEDYVSITKTKRDKDIKDRGYWECEYKRGRGCKGRAVTENEGDDKYVLISCSEHNHAAEASKYGVHKAIEDVKNQCSQEVSANLSSSRALRDMIKRVRREAEGPEPVGLREWEMPEEMRYKVRGWENFDFCNKEDFEFLASASVWVMDGTFKSMPNLFLQMYTIASEVGIGEGRKFLPKLWVLMTHKNMESYERLFEEIRDYAEELEVLLNVQVIITDFEQAVIRVIREQFPQARHKGCNFHLGQIIWRRIQGEGLAKFYGENEEGSLLLRHLGALAFLKDEEIEEAYNGLESRFRSEFGGVLVKLWEWFGENYVKGR
ncbi:hypothetical protein B4U79_05425, partial [Dinothrombium tinctorium]